ncbi:hypothetical protein GGX14DRAFT_384260 [Mycena pura]|uniref:Uncharacterized protein n=1 Tax=Mycena pura TaxID=153505 RepID=A0AAD6YUY3_9AGAR|nr:hypothetical protein GGX14DRAFT_384260 [Mycena pura]
MVNITDLVANSFIFFNFQGLVLDLSFSRPLENNPVVSNPPNGNPNQIWNAVASPFGDGNGLAFQTQVGPTYLSYSGAPDGFAEFAQTTVHANIPVTLAAKQIGTGANFAFFEIVTNMSMTAWPVQGPALVTSPVTFEVYHGGPEQVWNLTQLTGPLG